MGYEAETIKSLPICKEKKLLASLIKTALNDLKENYSSSIEFNYARKWINANADSSDQGFSFKDTCLYLGFSPEIIRREIYSQAIEYKQKKGNILEIVIIKNLARNYL